MRHLRWKPFDHYRFAAGEAIMPLVAQELPKACHSLPVASGTEEGSLSFDWDA